MVSTISSHSSEVLGVSINCHDNLIASSSLDGSIFVHDLGEDFSQKHKLTLNGYKCANIQFSYLKEFQLGSGHEDGTIAVWDVSLGKLYHKFEGKHSEGCSGITFSPVNHMLMGSVGKDKKVIFYDIFKSKKVVEDLHLPEPCTSVSFNHDGFTIAVGTTEGNVYALDLRNLKQPLKTLEGHHKCPISDVMFSHKRDKSKHHKDKSITSKSSSS